MQHQRDTHQRARDLAHRLLGRSFGDNPSSCITRSTFSTTTMASSTSRPIASTRPNIVSTLIENRTRPWRRTRPTTPPHRDRGDQRGAVCSARNRYMTRNTSTNASSSVLTTSRIDRRINGVCRMERRASVPAGKLRQVV